MNNKQKILIIGGGGREHAVGWKVAQSTRAGELFFAPGNGGTKKFGTNIPIGATEIDKLVSFAIKEKFDLALVVPDDPLALGAVDAFQKVGLRVWGPTKAAAKLEWSKAYSKDFMRRHGLPTARFEVFTDYGEALAYVSSQALPIVVKASGLALGKGVIICQSIEEAERALDDMFVKKLFGDAGNEVVIEEFLTGPEISIHTLSDGEHYVMFPPSQDHKKIGEGDTGLNTGGIGTIAPLPFVDEKLMKEIEDKIVAPTLEAMRTDGTPFRGLLYPGLILTKDGPKILEYNARFGDPEAQVYVRLLETDLLDLLEASIDGSLDKVEVKWKDVFASNIVLVSGGYPEKYEKGKIISGIEEAETDPDVVVFHAGTSTPPKVPKDRLSESVAIVDSPKDGPSGVLGADVVTNGGRVLGVSATGKTLKESLDKAYKAIEKITFEGMAYRRDIGKKSLGKT
jgi:phosphoribosylamine---glycine ligase